MVTEKSSSGMQIACLISTMQIMRCVRRCPKLMRLEVEEFGFDRGHYLTTYVGSPTSQLWVCFLGHSDAAV